MNKKRSILSLLFMFNLFFVNLYAQTCTPVVSDFTTQAKLDSFPINYPGCKTIIGNIVFHAGGEANMDLSALSEIEVIQGDVVFQTNMSFDNLTGLENLDSIYGRLYFGESSVSSFEGLNGLKYIGDDLSVSEESSFSNFNHLDSLNYIGGSLIVDFDTMLQDFQGLTQLHTINEDLIVFETKIQSFEGLNNLEHVGGVGNFRKSLFTNFNGLNNVKTFGGGLWIWETNVINLIGFDSLATINGGVIISDNQSLKSLDGLDNLTDFTISNLEISDNPMLTDCTIDELCNVIDDIAMINPTFSGNGFGCQSLEAIEFRCNLSPGECVPSPNDFWTQSRLDSFPINYPGCKTIIGNVYFGALSEPNMDMTGLSSIEVIQGDLVGDFNTSFVNFAGLENLDSINGFLYLNKNSFSSFQGLDGLQYIGGTFHVDGNSNFSNFDHLDSLNHVGGDFRITYDSTLQDFSGLGALQVIDGDFIVFETLIQSFTGLEELKTVGESGTFLKNQFTNFNELENLESIGNNLSINSTKITNMIGLGNVQSIGGDIYIVDNQDLVTFDGFPNLTDFSGDLLNVTNNPLLNECAISGLCNVLNLSIMDVSFSGNGANCNSSNDILEDCNALGNLYYQIFYDQNGNNIFDAEEVFIAEPGLGISIQPEGLLAYSNAANIGLKFLEHGNYSVELYQSATSIWSQTTPTITYNISLDGINNVDTVFFGLTPSEFVSDFLPLITTPVLRCQEYVTIDVLGKNLGTTTADGLLYLDMDTDITDIVFIDEPDTIIPPYTYGWTFEELLPSQSVTRQIRFKVPGPPGFPVGEFLFFQVRLEYEDQNGEGTALPFPYRGLVECSYDPNDKLVNPDRMNGYTLFSEDLIYTIRFQNTGNAEAYDVVIRDTLHPDLDVTTFEVLSSSHDDVLSTFLEEEQYLTFEFKNIFLPDSTSDFEGSQGYVNYRIRSKENLEEGIQITNTAGIYFDLNPPVITNTTENVLLSTFDFDEDGFELFVDCDDMNADVYPGAIDLPNNGVDEDCDGEDNLVNIQQILSGDIRVFPNPVEHELQVLIGDYSTVSFQLNDINGKEMLKKNITSDSRIGLSDLPTGVYIVLIHVNEDTFTERLIKL